MYGQERTYEIVSTGQIRDTLIHTSHFTIDFITSKIEDVVTSQTIVIGSKDGLKEKSSLWK